MTTYILIDCRTKEEIKTYSKREVAKRVENKKNLAYGAHHYSVRANFNECV